MHIWIFNPFDELPGDTDLRHRYWSLAATLADMGHDVTWWSSDWSHRSKSRRQAHQLDLNFTLRLIPTPPYHRNVSLARLRNHRAYANGILHTATAEIRAGLLTPPDRIVCSLPPLESPLAALKLRDAYGAEVILDYMDAWPESFYRVLPGPPWMQTALGSILLYPLRRAARHAIRNADRISAVSEIYRSLALSIAPTKPTHLCYHGIDLPPPLPLSTFNFPLSAFPPSIPHPSSFIPHPSSFIPHPSSFIPHPSSFIPHPSSFIPHPSPATSLAYIGALELSYDLSTAIRTLEDLNATFPSDQQIHFHIAGKGTQQPSLLAAARARPWLHFHGLLQRDALQSLLASCQIGIIPLQQNSWVGLPYKVADYCAAGLAVLSSLDGECRQLLDTKKAGLFYQPGSVESLKSQLLSLLSNPSLLTSLRQNARSLAESSFDRQITYPKLARFITTKP